MSDLKLCYVDEGMAYFTSQPLDQQWGDDWDDAPYEHNAGSPYPWEPRDGLGCLCCHPQGFRSFSGGAACGEQGHKPVPPRPEYRIVEMAYRGGNLQTPADFAGLNSRYSVDDINARRVPWLETDKWAPRRVRIWAGASPEAFEAAVRLAGGRVFREVAA